MVRSNTLFNRKTGKNSRAYALEFQKRGHMHCARHKYWKIHCSQNKTIKKHLILQSQSEDNIKKKYSSAPYLW
jgi:hypothetical protein